MEVTNKDTLIASPRNDGRKCKICVFVVLVGACLLAAGLFIGGGSSEGSLSSLDLERQKQVKVYMAARAQALQGEKKTEGVKQVLDCFIADKPNVKPVIDILHPEAERMEGKARIKKYFEDNGGSSSVIEDQGVDVVPTFVNGKLAASFVVKKNSKAKGVRLVATFDFEEGSALIQQVTVIEDTSKPPTSLDQKRQQMVRKYMAGRIEAFQGKDKASGVQQVLECFIPDSDEVKPTIDLKAPKAELAVGMEGIKHYLENPPKIPCSFKEGSNTDPIMVDGNAEVKFILKVLIIEKHLLATFEFEDGSPLIRKVTVVNDK